MNPGDLVVTIETPAPDNYSGWVMWRRPEDASAERGPSRGAVLHNEPTLVIGGPINSYLGSLILVINCRGEVGWIYAKYLKRIM